ncbi:MAG: class I adenylate cyclase, partial [Nitrospinales bacterium]
ISRGEFFGGSIWALIKAFGSPFKTLMKMGMLEEYMFKDSKSNLLCHEIKRKVQEGLFPYLKIDPYLNMFERVQAFFKKTKTYNEIDALRMSFYLKVGTQVNRKEIKNGSQDYKKATLIKMIQEWGWPAYKIEQLNDYKNWQMNKKVALGNRINKILMNSYKNISDKNKSLDAGESLINEQDTNLLGRKLYSYYRKAPYKVENLGGFVDGALGEKELTIIYDQETARAKGFWYLVRGKTLATLERLDPELIIKKAATLEYLLAFSTFNKLYNKNTQVLLRADMTAYKDNSINAALNHLSEFIARVNIAQVPNEDLLAGARAKQIFIILDYGPNFPREALLVKITTCKDNKERSVFIKKRLERLRSATYIFLNTWGELFCKTFSGLQSLTRCLNELAPQISAKNLENPDSLKIFFPTGRNESFEVPWMYSYIRRSLEPKEQTLSAKAAS